MELKPNISDGYSSIQRIQFWEKYIENIRNNIKNISHKIILNLFERAILDCFLFETENGLKYEIISICERNVRNINHSVTQWIEYVNACEWCDIKCIK